MSLGAGEVAALPRPCRTMEMVNHHATVVAEVWLDAKVINAKNTHTEKFETQTHHFLITKSGTSSSSRKLYR